MQKIQPEMKKIQEKYKNDPQKMNAEVMKLYKDNNVSMESYIGRERPEDEMFPWDFIDIGVTKDFLKREWERAQQAEITPNCRMQCSGCGAASFGGGVCFEQRTN